MAYGIWTGAGSVKRPGSGAFADAGNWASGMGPDAEIDAVFRPGRYTVSLDTRLQPKIGSLNVGDRVRLDVWGGSASVASASQNNGTIALNSSSLVMSGGLFNMGTILGSGTSSQGGQLGGTVTNAGLVSSAATPGGNRITLAGSFTNLASGVVETGAGGTVSIIGSFTNDGTLTATQGGQVVFELTPPSNLSNGVLSGGDWRVESGSTMWIRGVQIITLGAGTTVTLGSGSVFRLGYQAPFSETYLETTLQSIDAGRTLDLIGGRDYRAQGALTLEGSVRLAGGTLDATLLTVGRSGVLSGYGTVDAQADVDGTLQLQGRTLTFTDTAEFDGRIAGRGTLELRGGEDTFAGKLDAGVGLLLSGADVRLENDLTVAGKFRMTAGTLDIAGRGLLLEGAATLANATIHSDRGGSVTVDGTLRQTGGDSTIDSGIVKLAGQIAVDHGSLTLTGQVDGGGKLVIGAGGTLVMDDASRLPSSMLVAMTGRDATLRFDNLDSSGVRVAHLDAADRIVFTTLDVNGVSLSFRGDADGIGGTLTLGNGKQTASVHLEETHAATDFTIGAGADGGTIVGLRQGGAAFAHLSTAAFGDDAQPFHAAAMPHHSTGLELVLA